MAKLYTLNSQDKRLTKKDATANEPLQDFIENGWLFKGIHKDQAGGGQSSLELDLARDVTVNGQKPQDDESVDAFLGRVISNKSLIPELKASYHQGIEGLYHAIANNALSHKTEDKPEQKEFKLSFRRDIPRPRTLNLVEENNTLVFHIDFNRLDYFDVAEDLPYTLPGTVSIKAVLTTEGFKLNTLSTSNELLYRFLFSQNSVELTKIDIARAELEEALSATLESLTNTQEDTPAFCSLRTQIIKLNHCTQPSGEDNAPEISIKKALEIMQRTLDYLKLSPPDLQEGGQLVDDIVDIITKTPIPTSVYVATGAEVVIATALLGAAKWAGSNGDNASAAWELLSKAALTGSTLVGGHILSRHRSQAQRAIETFFADGPKAETKTKKVKALIDATDALVSAVALKPNYAMTSPEAGGVFSAS